MWGVRSRGVSAYEWCLLMWGVRLRGVSTYEGCPPLRMSVYEGCASA